MLSTTFRGWLPVLLLPLITVVAWPANAPRWTYMWVLATEIYFGCKWLTWRRTTADMATVDRASVGRQLAYLFLWPGMDAPAFLGRSKNTARPKWFDWLDASGRFLLGVALLFDISRLLRDQPPFVNAWAGMLGYMLLLHFGSFQFLSLAWRQRGIDARPLMDHPLHATSLADLWGRRWNTAFRDLLHRFLFRPMVSRFGPAKALWLGFVMSGLIHEVVMSIPAGGGYGGPTLYFGLQAAGLSLEKSAWGRRRGLGRGGRGWLFAMCCLAGPAPLLIHGPFVERVVLPFLEAIRW